MINVCIYPSYTKELLKCENSTLRGKIETIRKRTSGKIEFNYIEEIERTIDLNVLFATEKKLKIE